MLTRTPTRKELLQLGALVPKRDIKEAVFFTGDAGMKVTGVLLRNGDHRRFQYENELVKEFAGDPKQYTLP